MKKNIYLLLFLFLMLCRMLTAQTDTTLRENFDDNQRQWFADVRENSFAYIEHGLYYCSNKTEKGYDLFAINVDLKPYSDFRIETSLKHRKGKLYEEYGIVWGAKDKDNFFAFVISASGLARIYGYKNARYFEIMGHTALDLVKAESDNILVIDKKDNEVHYYLNDVEIYAHGFEKIFGNQYGYIVSGNTTISSDYFEVRFTKQHKIESNDFAKSLQKINMGKAVNSPYNELMPIISSDGNTLYFSRQGHPANIGSEKREDIWISRRNSEGKWEEAINIGKPLNNWENNSVVSVSADGNSLLLTNTYRKDGSPGREGVSVSHRTKDGWSIPESIRILGYENLNKFKNFSLCPDRRTMLMAIEKEDSYGDLDLYVSFLVYDYDSAQVWSHPINLGKDVNTFAADFAPFMAADGITLYYSTYGLPGYGDADIFKTVRKDSTWKNWTKPVNMGPVVNSADFDAYFSMPASGDIAYLVSNDASLGGSDIFYVPLVEEQQPEPVVLVQGRVLNKKTEAPLQADIAYNNLMTGKEAGIASSDPLEGKYSIVLPAGWNYSFFAQKDGFYPISDNLDLTDVHSYSVVKRDLYLAPIEVGRTVRLNNIFFNYDKAELLPASYEELNRLVKMLNDYKTLVIEIAGHTDSDGSDAYNQKLSEARAKAVVDYLLSKGIAQERLSYVGYGESKPIAPNTTKEGKALNRRVEFTILKG